MGTMANISIPIFWPYRIFNSLVLILTHLLFVIYIVPTKWLISQIHRLCYFIFYCIKCFISLHYTFVIYLSKLFTVRDSRRIQLHIYKLLPTRTMTRIFGKIARIQLPVCIRALVYFLYSKLFGVNLNEVEHSLRNYESLSSFFIRRLKENCRRIENSCITSPCDGKIVCYGKLHKTLHDVKGVDYDVCEFLGHVPHRQISNCTTRKTLFHCIIYLAPGDYHRFHSPCDWTILTRKYFPGKLLSVAPMSVRWFPGLLSINERVVYTGYWEHGYFSYVAVGATNVGSFVIHKDPQLNVNLNNRIANIMKFDTPITYEKGEEFGYFAMGSTIVLIFEAPVDFKFTCNVNDKIEMGTKLTPIE